MTSDQLRALFFATGHPAAYLLAKEQARREQRKEDKTHEPHHPGHRPPGGQL